MNTSLRGSDDRRFILHSSIRIYTPDRWRRPHGTAIVPATGRGFATSGNDQSVVMFDLKTYKAIGRIPAAEDADAIIYDAPSNRVLHPKRGACRTSGRDRLAGRWGRSARAHLSAAGRRMGHYGEVRAQDTPER